LVAFDEADICCRGSYFDIRDQFSSLGGVSSGEEDVSWIIRATKEIKPAPRLVVPNFPS
jgi:hypothetical protein